MRTLTTAAPRRAAARVGPDRPPIRICFIIDELAVAGTETQLLALIRHLDRTRFQPELVLLRGGSQTSRALEPDCCPVHRLGVGSLRRPATVAATLRLARWLRRERFDVVQTYFPDSSYVGMTAAWLAGVRHRLRTRNNLGHWMTTTHRLLGRVLNRLTTATIANCDAARHALLLDERPRPESVVVLENGVDLDRFLSLDLPAEWSPGDPVRVGAVANLRSVKGLDVLTRAFLRLAQRFPQMTLHLGGEGEQRQELEELARSGGVSERVRMPGRVSDVPGFLAELDIAVLPSRAEGMSNALLEYMAAARPVVATAVGAAPQVIRDGHSGLLVPPDDDAALAEVIAALAEDARRARSLAETARERVSQRFGRAAMVKRFEDYYESLLS
jgi:L-malate glycosyltransferase